MALFVDLVALSNGLHGSVQMDLVALFSWIGWLRHRGILNHLNTSYDLLECTYDDIVLQGNAVMNENGAFNEIVDRYDGPK